MSDYKVALIVVGVIAIWCGVIVCGSVAVTKLCLRFDISSLTLLAAFLAVLTLTAILALASIGLARVEPLERYGIDNKSSS